MCEAGPSTLEPYTSGAIATVLTMAGDDITQVQESVAHLQAQGVPVISAELESPAELGAELFKWEIATALACSLLQVNPFDEPDTQARRERASEIVEDLAACGEMPARRIRIQEREIELYAEGATRQQISTLSLADALRTFFELKRPDGYLALISFVGGGNPAAQASLERIRQELTLGLGMPVLLSAGPGYLHYFEQVYKGGPSKGLFLILTGDPVADLDIPGAGYTFGKLQLALAIADVDALDSREKPVLRLHLRQATGPAFAALEHIVQQALAGTRGLTR